MSENSDTAVPEGAEHIRPMSEHMADVTRGIVNDTTDVRDDMTGHIVGMMHERLEHLTKAFGAVAKAKSPMNAAQIYTDYLLDSVQRSAQQFGELGRMVARLQMRAWAPFLGPMKRTVADGKADGAGQ